jgi:DNA-directed RNA polymerase specialized sigma24 family protein
MNPLQELLGRIRTGDEAAAAEFRSAYEPHVRRVVRARMRATGLPLRRLNDSSDLCQVILASFLVGSAVGRYEIHDADALRRLLAKIATRRVIDLARRPEFRQRTVPIGRLGAEGFIEPVAPGSGPACQLAHRELTEKADRLLTDDEKSILELRKEGLSWEQVGQMLGKGSDAARKVAARAGRRIMLALGLEGSIDE